MGTQFRQVTIHFDQTSGKKQEEFGTAVFPSKVISAEAMLKGYNVRYKSGDHPTREQEIDLDIDSIKDNTVTVAAQMLLRDNTGNIDDDFGGWVQAVVIANVQ